MRLNLTDQMLSQFLSGVFTILILIAVGWVLFKLFKGMGEKLPFTRLTLTLALAPFCMVEFLDRGNTATLYFFSAIALLLGVVIDGINYLLLPKENLHSVPDKQEKEKAPKDGENPDVIVWEKAE